MRRRSLIASAAAATTAFGWPRQVWPAPPPSPAGPVDLLLVLAVDVSHSLDEEETRLQREGYHAALADAAVRGGAHDVAYVEWAGPSFQRLLVPWTRVAGRTDAEALVTRLAVAAAAAPSSHYFSSTAIAHGIVFSVVTLEEAPWEAARRVIDLSGDGVDNGGWTVPVEGARAQALQESITINGLAIEGDPDVQRALWLGARLADYYRASVIGGPGAFVIEADGFVAFREAVWRKLIREIAAPAPTFALA